MWTTEPCNNRKIINPANYFEYYFSSGCALQALPENKPFSYSLYLSLKLDLGAIT
jgi:hypothetical protein